MDDADLYGEVAPVQVRRGKHHSGLVLFQDTVDYCYRFTVLHRSRTAQHVSDDDHTSIITIIVILVQNSSKTTKKFFTFDVSTSIRGLHQKKLVLGLLLPVLGAIS